MGVVNTVRCVENSKSIVNEAYVMKIFEMIYFLALTACRNLQAGFVSLAL